MSITVYSKPRCPQCDATYRALDKQGISYEKIDVTQDADSLAFIKGLGYQQAPVVVAGEDHWSGFRHQGRRRSSYGAVRLSHADKPRPGGRGFRMSAHGRGRGRLLDKARIRPRQSGATRGVTSVNGGTLAPEPDAHPAPPRRTSHMGHASRAPPPRPRE